VHHEVERHRPDDGAELAAFSRVHPFAPREQARGYGRITDDLERWLAGITALPAVSLQPNSGAQGEYAGLLVIRAYHRIGATPTGRSA
jgi:glycine dehydrogenase